MATRIERIGQAPAAAIQAGLAQLMDFPDWLRPVSNAERVRRALLEAVPEFASGALLLEACQIKRLRLKRGQGGWTGQFELVVAAPDAGQRRTLLLGARVLPPGAPEPAPGAAGAFGDAEWRCYLPELRLALEMQPEDAALPAMPYLTDPERARALLEDGIRACSPAYRDISIRGIAIKAMRYKPGSRCTVVYQLDYDDARRAGRPWPAVVVAKTYHGDKGQNAYDGMRALWASALAAGDVVTLAEPLAYMPELRVLLQGPIPEQQTLEDLLRAALQAGTPEALGELHAYMRKTAAGLAALHSCGVAYGETITWEDEVAELREVAGRLAGVVPAIAEAVEPLLGHLEQLAAAFPADAPRAAHRAFRPAQVLLSHGQVGFIDFDGFGQAEPALDMSRFLRKTKALGLGVAQDDDETQAGEAVPQDQQAARLEQMQTVCAAFLEAYEQLVPVSHQRIALWETLDLLTLVLYCWTKIEPERLHTNMFLLQQHLRDSGQLDA